MAGANATDEAGLASTRRLVEQGNYDAARVDLKRVLAGDPNCRAAIDLLLRVDREDHKRRQAALRAKENPVEDRLASFFVWLDALHLASDPWIPGSCGPPGPGNPAERTMTKHLARTEDGTALKENPGGDRLATFRDQIGMVTVITILTTRS